MQLSLYILALLVTIRLTHSEDWNYHDLGPDTWSEIYPLCSGQSQSPIDILTACTTYKTFTNFNFSSTYGQTNNFTLVNNGHSIAATYIGNNPLTFTLTGGGLNGTFQFTNFHLHWGENSKSGSEHRV